MAPSNNIRHNGRQCLDAFFHALDRAPMRLLITDYDGTLAPFREQRMQAHPYPGVREILAEIQRRGRCRLVVVSGRPVEEVLGLLKIDPPPEIWGSHGAERFTRSHGLDKAEVPPYQREALSKGLKALGPLGLQGRIEGKTGCVAIHWRGLPPKSVNELEKAVLEAWEPLSRESGLQIRPFDGGLELRIPSFNKGEVVSTLLGESPEGTIAVYLGDDYTDEDAFRAIKGRGLAVLVREHWRRTEADVWLRPPGELMEFLRRYLRACTLQS